MKNIIITLLVLALFAAAPAFSAPAALDGKEFSGTMIKQGDPKGDPDSLIFKDGKFVSTECIQYGFNEVPYETTVESSGTAFKATTTNKGGVKMEWSGTVNAGKVVAKALWSDSAGKTDTYTFEGTLKR